MKYFIIEGTYRESEHEHRERIIVERKKMNNKIADKIAKESFAFGDEFDLEMQVELFSWNEIPKEHYDILKLYHI